MSVRGGGRPRDGARPSGSSRSSGYDTGVGQPWKRPPARHRTERYAPRRGSGLSGLVRFGLFSVILGGVILFVLATALRPLTRSVIIGFAFDNPGSMRIGFVGDLVREELGASLTDPASNDSSEIEFRIEAGDTLASLGPRLVEQGFIADERAFVYVAVQDDLGSRLREGRYLLRQDMTPSEVATALVEGRITVTVVDVTFREGLRLEQMVAKLQTEPIRLDWEAFHRIVTDPPASLLKDYPWLQKAGLPEGASLEGFLYPATYSISPTTTPEQLVRAMLDSFHDKVGPDRLAVPKERGLSFYEILALASIVEREAVLDEERATIAGVYQNRLGRAPRLLDADPTVIYGVDTVKLRDLSLDEWTDYFFWSPPGTGMKDVELPPDLVGFQTYRTNGLIPAPIVSPSVASIDAALKPDTKDGYFFFVAIPDGDGKHAFAKNIEQHDANLRKYGYR
jgi:UPF0755 protein